MSRDRTDLVTRTLKYLGVLVPGEAPTAELYNSINDEVPSVIANLEGRGIARIDPDEIQDDAFLPLARVLAAATAADVGIVLANRPGLANEPFAAEAELRALSYTNTDDVITFCEF